MADTVALVMHPSGHRRTLRPRSRPLADSSRMAADTGGLVTHSARHWQTCHLIYLFGHLLMHAPIVVVCDEY